eukprot:COSAG05_NODE_8435_length_702_cov_1.380165_1_plen_93_part_00
MLAERASKFLQICTYRYPKYSGSKTRKKSRFRPRLPIAFVRPSCTAVPVQLYSHAAVPVQLYSHAVVQYGHTENGFLLRVTSYERASTPRIL